jgi:hypothetical protein
VSEAPFRALGGAILADHGPIRLSDARALMVVYMREADANQGGWRDVCAARAQALAVAVTHATEWRRAAGWGDPEQADG